MLWCGDKFRALTALPNVADSGAAIAGRNPMGVLRLCFTGLAYGVE
jgi:hypothetical protein